MNEFQFYVYLLIMRVNNVMYSEEEELEEGEVLDVLFEVLFLILIVCSITGACLSILTTGFVPFETASISIFVFICLIIWFSTF
jgi:hypothetical protein